MAAAALLLTAPQAFASRTASTRSDLLPGRALEPQATTAALAPAYAPQGFELHASTDPHPASFALFDDLAPAPERVEPEKLASGVASWELTPNLQRSQHFVAEAWQVRENLGPVDSPNLYQAFGLDPQNNTDPLGLCGWWSDTPCREELAQAAEKVKGAVAGWFERNKQQAERIVEQHKQVAQKSGAELKRVYGALGQAVHDQIAHDATLVGSLPSATYTYFHSKHDTPEWKDANRTIGETVITAATYYVAWEFSGGRGGPGRAGVARTPVSPAANPRHLAQIGSVDELNALVTRLGERSVREGVRLQGALGLTGQEAGAQAERVFEGYLRGVNNRLGQYGSPYVVEWQPALLPGYGRVPPFVEFRGGAVYPFPDSLRMDAALSDTRAMVSTPEVSLDQYPTILRGYDITLDLTKVSAGAKYSQPFGVPVADIRPR